MLRSGNRNPLAPQEGSQLKYYAPGVGNIQVGAIGGKEKEVLVLTAVQKLDASAIAKARRGRVGSRGARLQGQQAVEQTHAPQVV